MSSIGPQLPSHLTKRKRSPEDESPDSPSTKNSRPNNENEKALNGEESDSDDGYGPSATIPAATAGPQRPSIGPTLPPTAASYNNIDEIDVNSDSDDDDAGPAPPPPKALAPQPGPKPKRVMGPAPPPTDLATRPTTAPDSDSEDDSEDDYGPALPSAAASKASGASSHLPRPAQQEKPAAPRRDDWMLAPPEPTGYQERDPTKIRARKFASGAGAAARAAVGGGVSSIWTETPEEKAKRLADAVLGRGGAGADEQQAAVAAASKGNKGRGGGGGEGKEEQDRIRAFTEQTRGRSLYEEHQAAKKAGGGSGGTTGKKAGPGVEGGGEEEEDDDPSKRAFDREKDMGLAMKITASQRKDLLNRASDFGGRFQKGNYL